VSSLPTKEAQPKWFIRPHHLQTLTNHPNSIKDDVLNTRYYSNYDQKYGVEVKRNEAEEAIKTIENHLAKLKGEFYQISA